MLEVNQLTPSEVRAGLMACFNVKQPVFIWGSPGIGKSQLIAGIAKEIEAKVYDLRLGQMDLTDLRGMPYYNKEENNMKWAPAEDLPTAEEAKKHKHIILFLDEMNTASPSVLASAYQLILDRAVGNYKLPDNVIVVAAGNKESDRGVTFKMPTPLSNRLTHFEMKVSFDDWFDWAVENNIHKDIVGYLNFAKQDLYDFDPKSNSKAFATPRSWTFVSDLIKQGGLSKNTTRHLVGGTVGEGIAHKFIAHRDLAKDLPMPRDILDGNVTELNSAEISAQYSLVIGMCYELKDAVTNGVADSEFHKMADNFLMFMMNNFETEMNVLALRITFKKYNIKFTPRKLTNYSTYVKRYGKYILNAHNGS